MDVCKPQRRRFYLLLTTKTIKTTNVRPFKAQSRKHEINQMYHYAEQTSFVEQTESCQVIVLYKHKETKIIRYLTQL